MSDPYVLLSFFIGSVRQTKITSLTCALLCVLPFSSCAKRTENAAITIVAPKTAWTWPIYIAKEGHYYEKFGLDVRLVFANHPAGIAMLVSDEGDVNLLPLHRAMEIRTREDTFVAVGSPVGKWLFALMARSDIASVQSLRGKQIGVAQIGDATYNYTIALLAKFGLSLRDVEVVLTGAEGRAPALTGGRVAATMLSAPAYFALERAGYKSLANISDYDDIYTPNVLLFKKSTVLKQPELPELLIKAHAEAVKRYYDDEEFAVKAHLVYDNQSEDDLRRVYQKYRESSALDRLPYIPADAVQYIINSTQDPILATAMKSADFATIIDNAAMDRLVTSGFFEYLFGTGIKMEVATRKARAFREAYRESGQAHQN